MKTIKLLWSIILFSGMLLFIIFPFQSCEPDDDDNEECDTCNVLRKPNIYLYPEEKTQISVSIDFPMGGKVITSIPQYGNGWEVTVDTNGLIDNTYFYLFYESVQPDIWQYNEGWQIKKEDVKDFFIRNMTECGFKGREITDFVDYWVPKLVDYNYYLVYPQKSTLIENAVRLHLSSEPDNILRLYYVIQGTDEFSIKQPDVPVTEKKFIRKGFVLTEWGVILK